MTPTTITIGRAASLLGVSRAALYRAASEGTAPVPILKVGAGRWVVPVAPLLNKLGLKELPDDETPTAA